MTHYRARQREETKRWDFACDYPVGYCAGDVGKKFYVESGGQHADKFHGDGHSTKEEAEACYHQYRLDNRLRFGHMEKTQRKCQADGCGEWSQGFAELGSTEIFILCEKHCNRETVEAISKPSEAFWES